MTNKKSFTLIELLVVVAIVGLLASIVLVSLQGVRDKAIDAEIKASVDQARKIAELYRSQNSSYEGLCEDSNMQKLKEGLEKGGRSINITCLVDQSSLFNTYQDYCYKVGYFRGLNLISNWCTDSKGYFGKKDKNDFSMVCKEGGVAKYSCI